MLLAFCLLFFVLNDTADSQTVYTSTTSHTTAPGEGPSCVLVATPDYPVAAGQTVHLYCSREPPSSIASSRCVCQRLKNQTWETVSNSSNVTLAEPKESGLYRCSAENMSSLWSVSQNHTVFIVAVPPTEEKLEITACVFSVLAFTISVAVLFWLGLRKPGVTLPISNTPKGLPAPENAPKVRSTQPEDDVYINYTSTQQAYTDLDPTKMSVASVYSTLS